MITDKPEAIMINVPNAFFEEKKQPILNWEAKEKAFRIFYETMGMPGNNEHGCFYHFISTVPVHRVTSVYVCFKGKVQYKAVVVEYLRNQAVMLDGYEHPEPRNWVVTTGPVIKAPEGMIQKGFRGFRYCKNLF